MSVNKHKPHLLVLPEDDANRQIANGFALGIDRGGQFRTLPVAGGWTNVLSKFETDHLASMRKFGARHLVLLFDFDNRIDRADEFRRKIPADMRGRIFLLGSLSDPEALSGSLGSFETIGRQAADDCRNGTDLVWSHPLLSHNGPDLERLRTTVRSILFSQGGP